MARRTLRVNVGLLRASKNPPYPSSPMYEAFMRAQSKALTGALLSIFDQFQDVSEDVMIAALEPTFLKAKIYVPKDTLALLESAYLVKNGSPRKPRVEMGFAKGGKPYYAMYVHEILDYAHAAPTRAKFLETAMKEDLQAIFQRLGHGYSAFMNGVSYG